MANPKKKSVKKVQTDRKPLSPWILLGGALLATLLVTSGGFSNGFTNWDDGSYVLENPFIKSLSWENIQAMFTETVMGNKAPITILSLAIDYAIYDLNPAGFHATNIFLHLACTAMVFLFIFRLSGRKDIAFGVALLFGIHPMHIETVAWISDRKDLLYTLFFLGGLTTYLQYLRHEDKKWLNLALTLAFFCLSLLSKATAVTFPVVLLGLDYLEKRKFDLKTILEKLPFFALSIYFGLTAIGAQDEAEALKEAGQYSFFENIFVASYAAVMYLFKLVIPFKLAAFHPYPARVDGNIPLYFYFMPVLIMALIYGVWRSLKSTRSVAFGVGFFLVTIALVLQLFPVGDAIIAERYTYLPYLGLFYVLVWGMITLSERPNGFLSKAKAVPGIALAVFAIATGAISYAQVGTWKDSGTLWSNVIEKYPEHFLAYNNRGNFYGSEGKLDLAFRDFNASLKFNPENSEALTNRGRLYKLRKEPQKALKDFSLALQKDPNNHVTYNNRGNLYRELGDFETAEKDFNASLRIKPSYDLAWNNRGVLYQQQKKYDEAIEDFTQATQLNPSNPQAIFNRGVVQEITGNFPEAILDYGHALELKVDYKEAWFNRSRVYWTQKDYPNALKDAREGQKYGAVFNPEYIQFLEAQVGR